MGKSIQSKEYVAFVKKLRQAREEVGLTQVQVAKKLKRSQSYVSKAEAGEQRLDIVEVQKFADLYGKEITFFTSKRK
ncbi:helix-turn-helix domain-containing protein [Candidatus Pacebacteria bacterium]|nr:helix-turn-helix domain-containing protein [Candidatus Paceibacterota bacterium]